MVAVWLVKFTRQAAKDARRIKAAGLEKKARSLIDAVREDPFKTPPSYEALVGSLSGLYSRRINLQHRFVYEVVVGEIEEAGQRYEGVVKVLRMWTHYEGL